MNKAIEINGKLTKRLLLYILLCSVCVSVCSTLVQLYFSFQDDITLSDKWRVTLNVRNATDKLYWTNATFGNDAYIRSMGRERTVSLNFTYNWEE